MSVIWTVYDIENKYEVYSGEDCLKRFSESLREHAMNIINFKKKKKIPLPNEQQELYQKTKICYICKKKLEPKYTNDKNYWLLVFHNRLNNDYHFVIKQLSKEFEGELIV